MIENEEVKIEGSRKYISFDPTLHAGHIMIIITVIIAATGAWYVTQSRMDKLEMQNAQRIIDNNYLAQIEQQHHTELSNQISSTRDSLHQEMEALHTDLLTMMRMSQDSKK